MSSEERALTFLIKHNELGYLPINKETVEKFTKLIEDAVMEERKACAKVAKTFGFGWRIDIAKAIMERL